MANGILNFSHESEISFNPRAPELLWAGLLLEGDTKAVGWPLQNNKKDEKFAKKLIAMNQQ